MSEGFRGQLLWPITNIITHQGAWSLSDNDSGVTISASQVRMSTVMVKSENIASVPAINPYIKAAQAYDIDHLPLLEEVGIDPSVLADNNNHISIEAMEAFLLRLIEQSGDPCFGLHASRFTEAASYSVLGYISMNCSTLRNIQSKIPIFEKTRVFFSKKCKTVITFERLVISRFCKKQNYSLNQSGSLLFSEVGHQRALSKIRNFYQKIFKF